MNRQKARKEERKWRETEISKKEWGKEWIEQERNRERNKKGREQEGTEKNGKK